MVCDCNGDGRDHLELAAPGLIKGVPTFVDKPFAHCVEDVRNLLDLSERYAAPVMSLSIMQAVPAARIFRQRIEEIEEADFGTIQGGGINRAGLIHTVCLALMVFGSGIKVVSVVRTPQHTSIHLDWGGREGRPRHGVMINCDTGRAWHCTMFVSAFGPGGRGAIHSSGLGDWDFPRGSAAILRLVKTMVETGQPQGPVDQMIEAVAVADTAERAIQSGQAKSVEDTGG